MDTRLMLDIVKSHVESGGDVYALAARISAKQREADAVAAEQAGSPEIAALIREAQ